MFIDRSTIFVKAGDGGNGVVSFRREKFVPRGGPDGGDGGNGGNIFLIADARLTTLVSFRRKRRFIAANGGPGRGKRAHGKSGEDLLIRVPTGTLAYRVGRDGGSNYEEQILIADLVEDGQKVLVARGGRGGRGNARFATSTRQAPRFAEQGAEGDEGWLYLELRLLADIGLIGKPNAGKSTLLAALTAARPKIAPYPFTTLEPHLGVLEVGYRSITVADIPGLIEGASRGAGLGHQFLKHIQRTRVIIHMLDGTSPQPATDFHRVNAELAAFDPLLPNKPQLIAVNKVDLPEVRERIEYINKDINALSHPKCVISAATGEGLDHLITLLTPILAEAATITAPPETGFQVFAPQPTVLSFTIEKEGETFVVKGPRLERLVALTDLSDPQAQGYLRRRLQRIGIAKALSKAGAKPGDRVRLGAVTLEW